MTTQKTFRIVAALDMDETARHTWAAAVALLSNPNAELSLLHVVRASEREVKKDSGEIAAMIGEGHRRVQELLTAALGSESNPLRDRIDVYVGIGDAATEIVQLAADLEADLIVVGTHGRRGLERVVLGSVSSEVLKKAPCAVLVARPTDYADREKRPSIAPAPEAGQEGSNFQPRAVARYRSTPFSTYNANLFPTGIPRAQVR